MSQSCPTRRPRPPSSACSPAEGGGSQQRSAAWPRVALLSAHGRSQRSAAGLQGSDGCHGALGRAGAPLPFLVAPMAACVSQARTLLCPVPVVPLSEQP